MLNGLCQILTVIKIPYGFYDLYNLLLKDNDGLADPHKSHKFYNDDFEEI